MTHPGVSVAMTSGLLLLGERFGEVNVPSIFTIEDAEE